MPDAAEPPHPLPLPPAVAPLVDGTGLDRKVGLTIVLSAVDGDGWPRQALLSVGEVLGGPGGQLRLALYPGSRTTRALERAGRGLLTFVVPPSVYKVCVEVSRLGAGGGPLTQFAARVVAVDEDRVGYARVTGGITYELPDPGPVIARWGRQLDQLRAAAP